MPVSVIGDQWIRVREFAVRTPSMVALAALMQSTSRPSCRSHHCHEGVRAMHMCMPLGTLTLASIYYPRGYEP